MDNLLDKLPDIPTYFSMYVDRNIDLNTQRSIPCPFHNETHGKSFSYTPMLKKWRCWGACHAGGDVIDLHRLNYKLHSREEAQASLCSIFGIENEIDTSFEREQINYDAKDVYRRRLYSLAVSLAKNPDEWEELDYILSKAPFDEKELEVFCAKQGHPIQNSPIGG